MAKTRIGIYGYGNLGRGVELACRQNEDLELAALFTRRDPGDASQPLTAGVPVYAAGVSWRRTRATWTCSCCAVAARATCPSRRPLARACYNVVDSLRHAREHPRALRRSWTWQREGGRARCALISGGWDPGMFSLDAPVRHEHPARGAPTTRSGAAACPRATATPSAASRAWPTRRQYTVPVPAALEAVRAGENPELTTRQKHTRECWVVAGGGRRRGRRRAQPSWRCRTTSPTTTPRCTFVPQEELDRDHAGMPHGGSVIRIGRDRPGRRAPPVVEYSLEAGFEPRVHRQRAGRPVARAVHRLSAEGADGLQDAVRRPARVSVALERRGAAREHAVGFAQQNGERLANELRGHGAARTTLDGRAAQAVRPFSSQQDRCQRRGCEQDAGPGGERALAGGQPERGALQAKGRARCVGGGREVRAAGVFRPGRRLAACSGKRRRRQGARMLRQAACAAGAGDHADGGGILPGARMRSADGGAVRGRGCFGKGVIRGKGGVGRTMVLPGVVR